MMIDEIKILLGSNFSNLEIDDASIHSVIGMASEHYLRYRPGTNADWGSSPRAHSWIMEYATAYCKLLLGETRECAGDLVSVALKLMDNLELELTKFA